MNVFEGERLLVQDRRLVRPGIFPGRDVAVLVVVAQRFAVRSLKLLAEMSAAGFVALQRIQAHQLAEFQEVRHASGIFQRLIEFFAAAQDVDVLPEFFAQFRNALRALASGRLRCAPCRIRPRPACPVRDGTMRRFACP